MKYYIITIITLIFASIMSLFIYDYYETIKANNGLKQEIYDLKVKCNK